MNDTGNNEMCYEDWLFLFALHDERKRKEIISILAKDE